MSDSNPSAGILAVNGPIDKQWQGFIPRAGQQAMAAMVDQAIESQQSLVIEAPSGSGKTLAYLVPILTQQRRAIISTASRFLQGQLYRQDIPLLQRLLGTKRSVSLLQGRSHYLCPYYLDRNLQAESKVSLSKRRQLALLAKTYRQTGVGDLDVIAPRLTSALRLLVTSGNDDCLGKECPKFKTCPLMLARQQAQQADIVVVNHSVLFADQLMRREQLGDLLPASDVVVVDEAHRVFDFVQSTLGQRLSSRKLKIFCRDVIDGIRLAAAEQRSLIEFVKQIERGITTLAFRMPESGDYQAEQHEGIVKQMIAALAQLLSQLEKLEERDQALVELAIRNRQLLAILHSIISVDGLCWVQLSNNGFLLQNIPARLSPLMKNMAEETNASWIFTSATLSVGGDPDRFLQLTGFEKHQFLSVPSDFDHNQQAKLFTPLISVEPAHKDYSIHFVKTLLPLLDRVDGHVLILFSSYQGLNETAGYLQKHSDYPLFVQSERNDSGQIDNFRLIERFKRSDKGVLLGTGSFWEGLDLSGVPLVAVVIDKLPFAPPNDPLIQLRAQELEIHGVDSFEKMILPEAVIRLRQGCGRLLRRLSDRGVIMIADPRLHSKNYGSVFIDSLPVMEQLYSITDLQPFLSNADNVRENE